MDEKLARWEAVLEPLVVNDPTMDIEVWKKEVEKLRGILKSIPDKFRAFLNKGYIIQQSSEK
jgi:hypothetical protein